MIQFSLKSAVSSCIFLLFYTNALPAFSMIKSFSCLQSIRRLNLENPQKSARIVAQFPDDYIPGEKRNLLIYLHSFGSQPEKFFEDSPTGMNNLLKQERAHLRIAEPISISLSLGPASLAGIPDHGLLHNDFVSPEAFWDPILKFIEEQQINVQQFQFFASSGGALNAFQMLRHQPPGIRVSTAVLSAFPNFTERKLPPAPTNAATLDPVGEAIRTQIESLIEQKLQDPLATEIFPNAALIDFSLPYHTSILILSAENEAMGYTPLNVEFAKKANASAYPVFHIVVSGAGHAGPYPNDVSVYFLENGFLP